MNSDIMNSIVTLLTQKCLLKRGKDKWITTNYILKRKKC